jgi:hypothetical protein
MSPLLKLSNILGGSRELTPEADRARHLGAWKKELLVGHVHQRLRYAFSETPDLQSRGSSAMLT